MTSRILTSHLLAIFLFSSLTVNAETLRFAWPEGATAKVQTRYQGRRAPRDEEPRTWDMSADFTMRIQRNGDRVVISRDGFTGWKGTFPLSIGGGGERLIDMIPAMIVSANGEFIGIEGHETARKQMVSAIEQSGRMDQRTRELFATITSDEGLKAIASDHWTTMVELWQLIELDPRAYFEIRTVTPVPQLGGGEIEITGKAEFVKETPCAGREDRRCVQFRAETGPNQKQVSTILKALLQKAGADDPRFTFYDQRSKVEIVVDKMTMLPQQLTVTRLQSFDFEIQGRKRGISEEMTKTYSFAWVLPAEKKG